MYFASRETKDIFIVFYPHTWFLNSYIYQKRKLRLVIFILSILISNSLFGQIFYAPTFINQCSNKYDSSTFWLVSDSIETYGLNNFQNEKIALPRLGKYQLHINIGDNPIHIQIDKNGINRDTFFLERITHNIYISNPPFSEYLDCDCLANGKISDFYFNGKKRKKGSFINGQLTDTLFSYFRNGQLSEIFIPKNKNWKRINYFDNGKIKSIYDVRKKYEKEFYPNGQLKIERNWSRKNKSTLHEYFSNGTLKRKQNHKKLEIYNQDKVAIVKMKRKEILVLERIFAKRIYGRNKFYEYKWENFDAKGIIKRKIIFNHSDFTMNSFPDSIQQIPGFLFTEIIFYFNGEEFKKMTFEYDSQSKKLFVFRKEKKLWIKENEKSVDEVYEMIENYTN